jgi:hypothetical protein
MPHTLTPEIASRFADVALLHVAREYPNKLDHVLAGPEDVAAPRDLHPIFYGSFDWHSCVHGYWLLATLLRRFPELPEAPRIRAVFAEHFTAENAGRERAYLERPSSRGFERPYGWAWLLMLAAELSRHATDDGRAHATTLAPLTRAFVERTLAFLPKAIYPVRAGTHFNTAFALALTMEYARAMRDDHLARVCADRARAWYLDDRDCPAWEPSQDDFLSPALIEVECMRRCLSADEHRAWLARFLPNLAARAPATLFQPATVSDRSDGKIAHLDGLNLSRAWCWRAIAQTFDGGDPRRAIAYEAADRHLDASLPHIAGDYMGEHWLATFALLALS